MCHVWIKFYTVWHFYHNFIKKTFTRSKLQVFCYCLDVCNNANCDLQNETWPYKNIRRILSTTKIKFSEERSGRSTASLSPVLSSVGFASRSSWMVDSFSRTISCLALSSDWNWLVVMTAAWVTLKWASCCSLKPCRTTNITAKVSYTLKTVD